MGLLLGWLIFSFVVGIVRSSRGGGFFGMFLLSLLLSPIIGLILALAIPVSPKAQEAQAMTAGDLRKCPQCAELVKREAKICRFCRAELTPEPASGPPPSNNAAYNAGAAIGKALRR
jgi:hypothetical protein